MEKERGTKLLIISILFMLIIGLTVAFAALSSSLNINGTAYLDASKWGIRFENLSSPTKIGSATTTGTAKIDDAKSASITGMNVSLSTPGDKIVYTVDLVNKGTINAKIDNIEKTVLTSEQQRYLTFKVTDDEGNEIKEGVILSAGELKKITITIEFIKDLAKEDLPTSTSTISLSYKLNFVQTDEKVTTTTIQPQTCTTFKKKITYKVGDVIAMCNTETNKSEDFYVIKNGISTVTAISKSNVNVETNLQDESINTSESQLAFAPETSGNLLSKYGTKTPAKVFDSNSTLYEPAQNYKAYLKDKLGKKSVDIRLITQEELVSLGCNATTNEVGDCLKAPSWVYNANYWTGSAHIYGTVWIIDYHGTMNFYNYDTSRFGLRPVITVSKSEL
jgi:hypothetical protein